MENNLNSNQRKIKETKSVEQNLSKKKSAGAHFAKDRHLHWIGRTIQAIHVHFRHTKTLIKMK